MFHFIYPVVVTVVMMVFFKERASVMKIAAIIFALVGLFLILDLSGNMSVFGVILAICSGFTYTVYVVANRRCSFSELPVVVIVFTTTLTVFIGVTAYQLATGNLQTPPALESWIFTAASGLLSHLFAIFMLTYAIRKIGASNAAVCNVLEPLTAMVAGVVVYSDTIPVIAVCGSVLMLLAILLISLDERRRLKNQKMI
jgi:drug/metabolite transporter (DMT)-like permease